MISQKYRDYIRSDAWKRTSRKAKERANYRCQVCGESAKILHTHHNTYKRLGNEETGDLLVVCIYCHWWITLAIRLRRWWRLIYKTG